MLSYTTESIAELEISLLLSIFQFNPAYQGDEQMALEGTEKTRVDQFVVLIPYFTFMMRANVILVPLRGEFSAYIFVHATLCVGS